MCNAEVKTSQSSTSNLFGHLESHHPFQHAAITTSATKKKKHSLPKASTSSQRTLFQMVPYGRVSEQHITRVDAVTRYLTTGCVPIYTVDQPTFRQLLSTLDPRFQCPGRNYFSQTAIPTAYQTLKTELMAELKDINHIAITTDGWTSLARDQYISLTTHYISRNWKLKTRCLETMYAPDSHTAENIASFVRNGLREFGLTVSNVTSITTDSAANMVAMARTLAVERFPCFGHVLHNAINNSLSAHNEIDKLTKACRQIVSVFSFSQKYRTGLQKAQKDLGLPHMQLVNDVSTRWGSKLKMFERVKQQQDAIYQLFKDDKKYRKYILSVAHQDLLKMVVEALTPYKELTDLLSGEDMVTVSGLCEMLCAIRDQARDVEAEPAEGDVDNDYPLDGNILTSSVIRKTIWTYVSERYSDEKLMASLALACMLDRRYRYEQPNLCWPSYGESKKIMIQETEAIITEKRKSTCSTSASATDQHVPTVMKSNSVASLLAKKRRVNAVTETESTASNPEAMLSAYELATREVEFFLSLPAVSIEEIDILPWWASHEMQFPHLKELARKKLATCATSVASERLFSLSGNVVSKKRNALKPQSVNMLVFLAFNQKKA